MLPDGMWKASSRNVRRKSQTTSATAIDLVQSQTHAANATAADRGGRTAGSPPAGIIGESVIAESRRSGPSESRSAPAARARCSDRSCSR